MNLFDLLSSIGSFMGISSLYLGPETTLPLLSLLAGIVGILLLFGRYLLTMLRKAVRFAVQRIAHLFGRSQA